MKMKNLFLTILIAAFCLQGMAQTAPDFTVTDIEGETHNLYEILDGGQHVLIDFFAYWCSICAGKADDVTAIYNEYGCNTSDLFVIAIEREGSNQQTINFENANAGNNPAPAVSGTEGGGLGVHNAFGIAGQPVFRLIKPDRSVMNVSTSSVTVAGMESILQPLGIEASSCSVATNIEEEVLFNITVGPNPVNNILNVNINDFNNQSINLSMNNLNGELMFFQQADNSEIKIDVADFETGIYLLDIKDENNNLIRTEKIIVQ